MKIILIVFLCICCQFQAMTQQANCPEYKNLLTKATELYNNQNYKVTVYKYNAAQAHCFANKSLAQQAIEELLEEVGNLKTKADKAQKNAEIQKNKAQKALVKQVEIYQENISEALNRFEIVEARGELDKVKQLGTDIVPQKTIAALEKQIADTLNKNLLADMVKVEGGKFMMGRDSDIMLSGKDTLFVLNEEYKDEKPAHKVQLSNFEIGKYEVTQALWQKIMGGTPPSYNEGCDNCPVENVSWLNIQDFLVKLEAKTGLKGFRLPTEAEWEYAAKGGKMSKNYTYAGSDSVDLVAWHAGNSGRKTQPIGTKQPNELGLYDMSGNVFEWCDDSYSYEDNFYEICKNYGTVKNPNNKNPANPYRILRGGSWYSSNRVGRAAVRNWNFPSEYDYDFGFRLVFSQY